jgi:hypothetical protein
MGTRKKYRYIRSFCSEYKKQTSKILFLSHSSTTYIGKGNKGLLLTYYLLDKKYINLETFHKLDALRIYTNFYGYEREGKKLNNSAILYINLLYKVLVALI